MITETNYSKSAMKKLMDVLPNGTMREIANKLNVKYHIVTNACYGKQYNKQVIEEIVKRFNQVKKSLTSVK
jgi:putative heme iron utilization protein